MGTQAINNLMNEVFYGQPDNKKDVSKDADFLKALENAQDLGDLETLSRRDVNVVNELTGKDEFEKERTYVKPEKEVSETDSKKVEEPKEVEVENSEKTKACDTKIDNSKDTLEDEEITEEDIEFIEENMSALVNAYSELLDLPIEAVEEYFEENDIKLDSLLDISNVKDIVMGLEGIDDTAEILTNQALFEDIETLKDFTNSLLNEISEELQVDIKDVASKVDEIISQIEKPVVSENFVFENGNVKAEESEGFEKDNFSDNTIDVKADLTSEIESNVKLAEGKNDSKEFKENDEPNQNLSGNNVTASTNFEMNRTTGIEQEPILTNTPEAQEIYNQIGEFVRSISEEELKEVTLQLQPETLGTIQVRVSQREGVLTAEMLTQNDSVKAALEGQLIELQKDFEKSGIKVESIEVKVSTQSFDEQSQEDARNEENEAARREIPQRRINLNGLFETDDLETLEDDERIAVEMMTANGNSLDYQA